MKALQKTTCPCCKNGEEGISSPNDKWWIINDELWTM